MKRILFSPIGNTDPIKQTYDGALLHIIRKYKPDVVHVYASKRIIMNEDSDQRYTKALEYMMGKLGYSFDIVWHRNNQLTDVHVFDQFLNEFKSILDKIYDDDAEILLNVSSGTPAMKSALHVLASLYPKPLIPIQVADPDGITKHRNIVVDNYDINYEWELDQDNDENYRDRCTVSAVLNQTNEIRKNIIKEHVDAYDYVAALRLAEPIEEYLNPDAVSLIRAGAARLQLDKPRCQKNAQKAEYDVFPKKTGDEWRIFEFLMLLDIKQKKNEYADFIRALTPLFFEILQRIVKNIPSFDYSYYTFEDVKHGNSIKWNKSNCDSNATVFEQMEIRIDWSRFVSSSDLDKIISNLDSNAGRKKLVNKLRIVEEKVRNYAAHTIMDVTENKIQELTKPDDDESTVFSLKEKNGFCSRDIFDMLKQLIIESGIKITADDLKTYDKLNEEIKARLG